MKRVSTIASFYKKINYSFLIFPYTTQKTVLENVLYLLFTDDLLASDGTLCASFADDTAILASYNNISAWVSVEINFDNIQE